MLRNSQHFSGWRILLLAHLEEDTRKKPPEASTSQPGVGHPRTFRAFRRFRGVPKGDSFQGFLAPEGGGVGIAGQSFWLVAQFCPDKMQATLSEVLLRFGRHLCVAGLRFNWAVSTVGQGDLFSCSSFGGWGLGVKHLTLARSAETCTFVKMPGTT